MLTASGSSGTTIGFPFQEMTSVNGNYMTSGSKYAPNVNPIQSAPTNMYYYADERDFNEYPPIGQLVPVGDNFLILVIYALIYGAIKISRKLKYLKK